MVRFRHCERDFLGFETGGLDLRDRRKGRALRGRTLPAIMRDEAEVVGRTKLCAKKSPRTLRIPEWYALYTRSHCEQLVWDQLVAKSFHLFLPRIAVWSQRAGGRHRISVPMFPGYLFLRHAIDKVSYINICKTRGLVRILGESWDRLSVIPHAEIEAIQAVLSTSLPTIPYPYLREGQQVRITRGPLRGIEGVLVYSKPLKGLLILSIDLLQRSVAVEVDCSIVTAA